MISDPLMNGETMLVLEKTSTLPLSLLVLVISIVTVVYINLARKLFPRAVRVVNDILSRGVYYTVYLFKWYRGDDVSNLKGVKNENSEIH